MGSNTVAGSQAMNVPNNWQGGANGVVGNYTFGPSNPNVGYIGMPNPGANFNWHTTNITGLAEDTMKTSLEVFEELVGLIKLVELKLNLDHKDDSKHKWLEMIMGRIQEETINDTLKRLKALEL